MRLSQRRLRDEQLKFCIFFLHARVEGSSSTNWFQGVAPSAWQQGGPRVTGWWWLLISTSCTVYTVYKCLQPHIFGAIPWYHPLTLNLGVQELSWGVHHVGVGNRPWLGQTSQHDNTTEKSQLSWSMMSWTFLAFTITPQKLMVKRVLSFLWLLVWLNELEGWGTSLLSTRRTILKPRWWL